MQKSEFKSRIFTTSISLFFLFIFSFEFTKKHLEWLVQLVNNSENLRAKVSKNFLKIKSKV